MTTLKQNEMNRYSRILGYGAARGEVLVHNNDIVEAINSSDEWITQRTGISTRHRASENQSVADLAFGSAHDALAAAGVEGADIGAVIVSTISHPYATPSGQNAPPTIFRRRAPVSATGSRRRTRWCVRARRSMCW